MHKGANFLQVRRLMLNTYSRSVCCALLTFGATLTLSLEGAPRYRPNQASMTAAEKNAFVGALHSMKNTYGATSSLSLYDQFVETHLVTMDQPILQAHMGPAFLPWHRQFLWEFETNLLEHDSTGLLTGIPFWDWTADQDPQSGPWTADFLGGTGDQDDGDIVKTGPFALSEDWLMFDDPEYPLTRSLGNATVLPSPGEVAQALQIDQYDASPWTEEVDASLGFRNFLEGWRPDDESALHNSVHRWVGGLMNTMASPFDPVFWLHHSFVDRIWYEWQSLHGIENYLPLLSGREGHILSDELVEFGVLISDTLDPSDYGEGGYNYEGLVIPEPSTYALGIGAVALLWTFQRRRKTKSAAG